jgi:hypothetical protein
MNARARLTVSIPFAITISIAFVACRGEEPLLDGDARCRAFHQTLTREAWVDKVDTADNGRRLLTVWIERSRDATVVAQEVWSVALEHDDGVLVGEPRRVARIDGHIWAADVVGTSEGFLVFVDSGDGGIIVSAVNDDGEEQSRIALPIRSAMFEIVVAADDDGATLLGSNGELVRVDAVLDEEPAVVRLGDALGVEMFCTSAVASTPGRLLAACIEWIDDTWGASFMLDMSIDGSDVVRRDLDEGSFVPSEVQLTRASDAVFAVFGVDGVVHAAVLGLDGAVLAAPIEVGRAEDSTSLLGVDVCTSTCAGLSIATVSGGARVGFTIYDDVDWGTLFARAPETHFASVTWDGTSSAVAADERVLSPVHMHASTSTAAGPLLSWISATRPLLPGDLGEQRIIVERGCL